MSEPCLTHWGADNYIVCSKCKIAEQEARIKELEARELGWLTTLSSMELEARQLRAENPRLRCSHDWQVVDAHSEDCRVCGESRLSPLGGGEK